MITWEAKSSISPLVFTGLAKSKKQAKSQLAEKTQGMSQDLADSFAITYHGAPLLLDDAVSESLEAIDHGALCLAKIRAVNKAKIESGAWDQQKFQNLLLNQEAAAIERALWTGSFQTAIALIQNFSADFYNQTEKAEIIALISSFEE